LNSTANLADNEIGISDDWLEEFEEIEDEPVINE
jgi:hypothetical protein